MSFFLNKLILILFILSSLIENRVTASTITVFLTAIIFTSLISYFEGNKRLVFFILFCTLLFFWQPLFIFLPLAVYDGFSDKILWKQVLCLLPLLRWLTVQTASGFFFCLTLCMLAAVLSVRTNKYHTLLKEYHHVRDDTTEAALLLKKQNRELIKNQDYEIELATLKERNRIAREIHDNVGHLLTRSILQVSALLFTQKENPLLLESLQTIKETLSDAMNNVRQSVHNLHDDFTDLKQSLEVLIQNFSFCPVSLTFNCNPLPTQINYAVLAIAKEALTNIARHSNATEASVSVLEHPSFYQIIIWDNGTPKEHSEKKGLGLTSMEERILALNGIFTITRTEGFRIFISIPKNQTLTGGKQHERNSY